MKKIRILLALALIIPAVTLAGCSKDEEGGETAKAPASERSEAVDLLAMVPENTQFLVKLEALGKFYEQFVVSQNTIMGVALKDKDIEKIKTGLGFNPLNAEEVRQAGFNLEKPFCLAATNVKLDPADKQEIGSDVFGLLPLSEGADALDTIRSGLRNNNVLFVEAEKDGVPFIKWHSGQEKGCLAVKDQYLYMTINSQTDPQLFLESVIENTSSLTNAEAFRTVASETDLTRGLVFYANIADIVEKNSDQLTQAAACQSAQTADAIESLGQYSSAALTVDLGSPDLEVNSITALVDDHEMKKIWSEDCVNRQKVLSITEPAALLLSFGANIKGYYDVIKTMTPPNQEESIKTRMDAFKEKTGIDPETELLDNLSGSINFGLYDGASITMLNYNALFTAGIKDEKLMKQVIDKAIKLLPPDKQAMVSRQKVGGTDAYVVNAGMVQMYTGVDDNKLLLASGKPIFEKALKAEKDKGFAQKLTDERLKNSLTSNRNIFYLNIDEGVKTANNFAMFLAEPAGGVQKFKDKLDAAGRFEYVLASGKLDKNIIKSQFIVKTRFSKPFFLKLAQMIDEFEPEENSLN
ncbi:MAG: hypothetical protein R6X08_02120 [Desulfosalsimonadaceae bacterium]